MSKISVEELAMKRERAKTVLSELFKQPVGKDIIDMLESEFNVNSIKGIDVYDTYYKLGLHDALTIFKKLGANNNE